MTSFNLNHLLLAVPGGSPEFGSIMESVYFFSVGLFITVVIIWLMRINLTLLNKLKIETAARQGIELPATRRAVLTTENIPAENLWLKIRKRFLWNNVPLDAEHTIDLRHEYDGIRELDNNLPPWWLNLFYACVLWSGVYMWYYHFGGGGPDQIEEYNTEMLETKTALAIQLAQKGDAVNENNVTALADAGALAEGAQIFATVCKSCHGEKGQGINGPNLTDAYWIHGGGIKNVFKTIKYGVVEKGMTAWGDQMSATDIQKVASYVLSLAGTQPPGAKEPEGQIWKEEATSLSDSVSTAIPAQPPASSIDTQ